LVTREVFETIAPPYFEFIFNDDRTEQVKSEDLNFCERAKLAGFDIYADTDVICEHYKDIALL
jgi:GT2 family glycosyltransferase